MAFIDAATAPAEFRLPCAKKGPEWAVSAWQSRRGACHDNALPGTTQAESLWSRLKTEVLELREWPIFTDLANAQVSVAGYFDYHNQERLHSTIGYKTHIALINRYLKLLS